MIPLIFLPYKKTLFSIALFRKAFQIIFLLFLSMWLVSCASVTIKKVSAKEQTAERRGDILTTGKLSSSSQEVLRVIGKDIRSCQKDALSCQELLRKTEGITEEQRLSTLAELWFQIALERDKKSGHQPEENIHAWLEVTRYAYAYLFFSERKASERAFEDRQIQVRDYYNYASQKSVSSLYALYQKNSMQAKTGAYTVKLGQWIIDTDLGSSGLSKEELPIELISASSISFSGIRNVYRRDGFGTDMIAILPHHENETRKINKSEYIRQTYIPITALLQFEGKTLVEVLNTNQLSLTLFNPYKASYTLIRGKKVPLTANFTANYGLWLARSGFAKQAMQNLFGRKGGIVHPQLYLMQPYDPNRRVAIMLHGLASSPEAWVNVTNELLGDEKLRDNYQVWIVYYPTNAPIILNNHDIYQLIDYTLKALDPTKTSKSSQNVTLIGHSMGGVISRLMLSDSKDLLMQAFDDDTRLSPEKKAEIREQIKPYLTFKPLSQAKSGIFIAAPHRGTPIANRKIVRWLANLIYLPTNMIKRAIGTTLTDDSQQSVIQIPNSIQNLSDQDAFMQLTSKLEIDPQVTYYSIIGNYTPQKTLIESSDGIVPYTSSHLEGACSETIINSFHSVQETPEAILQIRHILKNQLKTNFKCH